MVPNSLSTNGQDDKPAKIEAETSHETVEVHYMMPNIGSNISSNTNSKQCGVLDKSPSKVRFISWLYPDSWCCCIYCHYTVAIYVGTYIASGLLFSQSVNFAGVC